MGKINKIRVGGSIYDISDFVTQEALTAETDRAYNAEEGIKAEQQRIVALAESNKLAIDKIVKGEVGSLINITYLELVKLRDNGELIPGMKYRITDYVTTTVQENTQSAGHPFDIIVEALSEYTLSENARAIQNENNRYFDGSNLEAWELKYCLDNDTSRFIWADTTDAVVNSKNVNIIDTLITDNEFNEPFLSDYYIYVDTAGNNVNRYTLGDEMRDNDFFIEYGRETSPDGLENQLCIYKNDLSDENYIEGGAEEGADYADKFFYWGTEEVDGIIYDKWRKSEVDSGWNITEDGGSVFILTQKITTGEIIKSNGKGVIYYMKDEHNNECPYDFKNIMFVRYKLNPPTVGGYEYEWQNQLSKNVNVMFENNHLSYIWHGSNSEGCYWEDGFSEVFSTATEETKAFYTFSNVINDEITDKSLTNVCYSNVIKESYENGVLNLNNNIFFSEHINDYCNSNSFGNDCYYNSFGNYCYSNSFGNYCNYNSFGNYCNYNSFGNNCYSNSFGNDCNYNSFGNDCYSNGFYDDASYVYNEDVDDNVGDGNRLNYVQYVTLNEGCHHLLFHTTESDQEHKVQNITVTKGVKSIETNDDGYTIPLLLEIPVTNNEYELKIARNIKGDIKMYCEADLIG